MNYNFYILDDDVSVVKILSNIIVNHNLGDVCGSSTDGESAIEAIQKLKPDIVFVDLLLPKLDGITVTNQLKPLMPETPFIMISEVYAKEMVSKAYNAGIEFYINKPINVIEVINVVKHVDERMRMKQVIHSFQNAFQHMQALDEGKEVKPSGEHRERARHILYHLGIASESGTMDILNLVEFLMGVDDGIKRRVLDYKLSSLYHYLSDKYEREKGEIVNVKTIEQRIRRTIAQGLENISERGLQDYDDLVFTRYGSSMYDFKEVRREMTYLKGLSEDGGKINIRKFFTGLIIEMQNI
ncbi:MAG: two-component system, response regulator GlnL [Clostridiales bacterium]|nr:two-component system, response regulator GlnL [Clostridiales bacterium]